MAGAHVIQFPELSVVEDKEVLNRDAIKEIIPHRDPMLLVDEAKVRVFHSEQVGEVKKPLVNIKYVGTNGF